MNTQQQQAARRIPGLGTLDQKVLAATFDQDFDTLYDRYNCPTDAAVELIASKLGCDGSDERMSARIYTTLKALRNPLQRIMVEPLTPAF